MSPKLNFKIIGQGKPIIILHGLFGMLDNWLNMAKRLEDAGHMVVLVDQRDHGRSEHTLSLIHIYIVLPDTPYYDIYGYKLWGATAMIISELEQILKED